MLKLKRFFKRIRRSIWLYPALYSIFAVVLAFGVILIDARVFFDASGYIPSVFLTSTELAKNVLGIIASAFITIMTFTFSTTMVVLTMYTSQFSPRVVENFLEEKSTMKAFGIFVSGFLYAIISLLFIRDILSDYRIIAGTIGVVYIVIGIFNFIIFIHNVGTYTQASNLIDRLFHQASQSILKYCKVMEQYSLALKEEVEKVESKLQIKAPKNGYLLNMDYLGLLKISKDKNIQIVAEKVHGQFVTEEDIVLHICYSGDSDMDQNTLKDISSCIVIGERRNEEDDLGFALKKLVEVSLKALSPGINDPNTAILCIQDLGLLMRELAVLEPGFRMMEDAGGEVYREGLDFGTLLRDVFHQIIYYGKGDFFVMMSLMKALGHITENISAGNQPDLENFLVYTEKVLVSLHWEKEDQFYFQNEIQGIRLRLENRRVNQ